MSADIRYKSVTLANLRCLREISPGSMNVLHLVSAVSLHGFAICLYCNVKPLFIKKVFFVFTFASAFLICSLSCSSLSWNGLDRFPTITKSSFCKELSCQTAAEQHPLRCPLGGATLLSYSRNNELLSPSLHSMNPQIAFFEHCKVKGTPACAAGVPPFWFCHTSCRLCFAKVRDVWGHIQALLVWQRGLSAPLSCEPQSSVSI